MPTTLPDASRPDAPRGDAAAEGDSGFRLTGRHVFIMLCCFFGVMLTVNIIMARFALTTFRGEVTARPYETGLKFNAEIAEARAQNERDWRVEGVASRGADGVAHVDIEARDRAGAALAGLEISVTLEAPADRKRDRTLKVREMAPGRYSAIGAADRGAWDLVLTAKRNGERVYLSRNRITLN